MSPVQIFKAKIMSGCLIFEELICNDSVISVHYELLAQVLRSSEQRLILNAHLQSLPDVVLEVSLLGKVGQYSLDLRGLSSCRHIKFRDGELVTSLGRDFLRCCESLVSADLSGFTNVTSIGDRFLSQCSALTPMDCSGLSSVTSIGKSFLQSIASDAEIVISASLYGKYEELSGGLGAASGADVPVLLRCLVSQGLGDHLVPPRYVLK